MPLQTVKAVPQSKIQDMQANRKGWLPTLMNSANAAESTKGRAFEFNLRFAGQYEDSESGYYYNWHRYYNPETGRYLTSDPIGINGGLNTYGYAGANPVQAVDPWGLFAIATWDDTVNSSGRTKVYIDIPILFTGPYKNAALEVDERKISQISRWKSVIEKTYTGFFSDFDICTKVTLLEEPTTDTYNDIKLRYQGSCDPTSEQCNPHIKVDDLLNEGTFFSDTRDTSVAHEAGHMLGIGFDPYHNIPYRTSWARWKNVMGNSLVYENADWLMFSIIFDSSALMWKDGKKPKFVPYNQKLDIDDIEKDFKNKGIEFDRDKFLNS